SAFLTQYMLPNESERSSTTMAIVRCTFSGFIGPLGRSICEARRPEPLLAVVWADTFDKNERLEISCLFPFSYISISSGRMSDIGFPSRSVIEMSNWIRFVEILTTSSSLLGGVGAGDTV